MFSSFEEEENQEKLFHEQSFFHAAEGRRRIGKSVKKSGNSNFVLKSFFFSSILQFCKVLLILQVNDK